MLTYAERWACFEEAWRLAESMKRAMRDAGREIRHVRLAPTEDGYRVFVSTDRTEQIALVPARCEKGE